MKMNIGGRKEDFFDLILEKSVEIAAYRGSRDKIKEKSSLISSNRDIDR